MQMQPAGHCILCSWAASRCICCRFTAQSCCTGVSLDTAGKWSPSQRLLFTLTFHPLAACAFGLSILVHVCVQWLYVKACVHHSQAPFSCEKMSGHICERPISAVPGERTHSHIRTHTHTVCMQATEKEASSTDVSNNLAVMHHTGT